MSFLIKYGILEEYKPKNCETSVIIPDYVTYIGNSAFSGCYNLTSITLPDSIKIISNYSFAFCENLTSVTLSNNITSIGNSAFNRCVNLSLIVLPNSVTNIGDSAFMGCKSLTAITIPDSVISIGNSAFMGCESLTAITLPDSVTSIGFAAFCGCIRLTSIAIPDSVTGIGDSSFAYCENLISITIPDSVTSIGNSAFIGCKKLTSITIPDSVTSIDSTAFEECNNLNVYTTANSYAHYFFMIERIPCSIINSKPKLNQSKTLFESSQFKTIQEQYTIPESIENQEISNIYTPTQNDDIDLKVIIGKYPQCLDSASKFKAILSDLYPQIENKSKIHILKLVYELDVINEVKNNPNDSLLIKRMSEKLSAQYFIDKSHAERAVKMWVDSLS